MKISVFKKCIAIFLLISRSFVIYGSDYLTDPTPEYLPNKYTLDDKKILELDASSHKYDNPKNVNINTIITSHSIEFSDKGSFNTKENWKITKLIAYFKQLVFNLPITFPDIKQNDTIDPIKLSELLKKYTQMEKGRFYYTHTPPETYYGVDHLLKGRNLIGKIIQKMHDYTDYIPRIQQKIEASEKLIAELNSKAIEYNTTHQKTGWKNIKEAVYFYDQNKPYYEFTNFFKSQVYVDGIIWPTSEHYYQSMKFTNSIDLRKNILKAKTPRDAFNIAKSNTHNTDEDWKSRSLKTMIKVVWLKFNQHDDLKNLLLETANNTLIEAAGKNDSYYGAGEAPDYKGQNWLGCILMAVRDKLNKQEEEQKKLTKKNNPSEINNQRTKQPVSSFPNQSSEVFVTKSMSPKTESWSVEIWQAIKNFFSWLFG